MRRSLLFFVCIFSMWLTLDMAMAYAGVGQEETDQTWAQEERVPDALSNPRKTMATFLSAMQAVNQGDKQRIKDAVATLDLSDINKLIRKSKGEELAYTLSSVIERSKKVVLSAIPTHPRQDRYVFGRYSQGRVEIVKQPDGRWMFSKETVAALPAILEGLIEKPAKKGSKNPQVAIPFYIQLRSQLPEALKGGFLLQYWQWIGIFILVLLGSIADKFLAWLLAKGVAKWETRHPDFVGTDHNVLRPLGLMAMALIWWSGLNLLGLPETALIIFSVAIKLLVSLSGVWSAFRLVDVVNLLLTRKALRTENKFDDLLVPMISKTLKVSVAILGVIFVADNLDIDITSLLAGLGLGGLAFALAAKDLLGNFFGSLTVLLDRPFHIGDWVIVGDVEGTVEEVGFRSTRIRTFYNSLITLPNALLTTTKIDNMGARRYRRMKTMLGLTYDTPPEKIEAFCEGIRTLVQLHPYMRKDYYQVYFNQYGPSSLDILVYVFWQTPDWGTELRERHRFLLDIMRLADRLGVEFAYPTQTVYVKQEENTGNSEVAVTAKEALQLGQQTARAVVDDTAV